MAERPIRAHVLEINLGADTKEDVLSSLRHILFDLDARGLRSSVSGGPSSGHLISYQHNPDMTHERYIAQLDEYLASLTQAA